MTTPLDRAMPVHHVREHHSRLIAADPGPVWEALVSVRLDQLSLTRPLMLLRHLGRPLPSRPLFTDGPVSLFEVHGPRYAVGGAISRPWQLRPHRMRVETMAAFEAFDEPGWAKYLLDFRLTEEPGGTRLSTETRGYATDARSRRLFRAYWTLIRPAGGVVRRDILATVDRLATGRARPA